MANRLAQESSPYLLQHQDNPVHWQPWDRQALDAAVGQDKPIFLSIGYSACHWCHVMERESFENQTIAKFLNENFISIKVDREERPDLDQIYMDAVMALRNGQGGWPLNVFLTPQQDVFFGGTYWPPTEKMGMPGFDHVLRSVLDAYINRREQVDSQSKQITEWLNRQEAIVSQPLLNQGLLIGAAEKLHENFDFEHGGFGDAPKFPRAMDLALLIRLAKSQNEDATIGSDQLLGMVRINLKKMAYGGIFDHLAGGFARYSVDELWLVPHFEKMLYDNALLAGVYLDMYAETGDPFYAMIARKTCDYLLNYMTDEAGGFHSAEDADSEGVEGKFYVWSKSEIIAALGEETGQRFCELYNVTETGNFDGKNILNMTRSYQDFADALETPKQKLRDEMKAARTKLSQIRDQRIRPGKDNKVITSWNALAISALARASSLLNDQRYYFAATRACRFIFTDMIREGRLQHTWRKGTAKFDGYLDDYSYLINALIDMYEVDFEHTWIDKAVSLTDTMLKLFISERGGFYYSASDQAKLIARPISFQDSSVPNGNSMAALALIRLSQITGKRQWLEAASNTIKAASDLLQSSPLSCGQMLLALNELLAQHRQLVVIANTKIEMKQIQDVHRKNPIVNSVFVGRIKDEKSSPEFSTILNGKELLNGEPTLYVCCDFQCDQPVSGLANIEAKLVQLADSIPADQ